ncbi:MAG: hypothetical protein K9G49_14715 [Taibaiella sp.]|nr:hypothetical protein [Taibaiella sp.]
MKFTICLLTITDNSIVAFSLKDIANLLSSLKKATTDARKIDGYWNI